jgi:uncharacterized repeat protein (TIGR01451 family)
VIFKQFYLPCLAHASYIVGDEATGTAAVVDPQRDTDQYIAFAAEHGLKIKHVFLTHLHADFVAGHLELRDRVGAAIYLGAAAKAAYAFTPLRDGDILEFGRVRLKVLETPGHTPESISILVYDLNASGARPYAVLTGDTLFIGDVGRPDLRAALGWSATELGGMLFDSLHTKLLEDHGVNMVFNGHEHNYQRSLPIRSTARTAGPVSATAGSPAVFVDVQFNGSTQTVPDGVLYLVEGAGGNRDFDGDFAAPRGSGVGLDQDDSATGTFTDEPGLTVPQGPASWLDTNLTNPEMVNFVPGAGQGAKITAKFKAKVFSFGDVQIDHNKLTLFQISEPLQTTSSATSTDPAPFGTDINGKPLNDPIPDTEVDPATGLVVSGPATGASALLDKWTVTKPEVAVSATLSAPETVRAGKELTYTVHLRNHSQHSLNGTQVKLLLPRDMTFTGMIGDTTTVQGNEVVVTLGRLATGAEQIISIETTVSSDHHEDGRVEARAVVTSSTALPVFTNSAVTTVRHW